MKPKPNGLSERYVVALEKHLKKGSLTSLKAALELGREAVALGMDTLDLCGIHERAILTLELAYTKNKLTRLAEHFFTEANTLIEETRYGARRSRSHLSRMMVTLGRRTKELANAKHQLQQNVFQRKVMENDFIISGKLRQKSLEESLELQNCLRQLTHQVIAAQEDERKRISHELGDEIAQTLLGINVGLFSLKQEARNNSRSLKKEIANTQRLVAKSARSVKQVGCKVDLYETKAS